MIAEVWLLCCFIFNLVVSLHHMAGRRGLICYFAAKSLDHVVFYGGHHFGEGLLCQLVFFVPGSPGHAIIFILVKLMCLGMCRHCSTGLDKPTDE